MQKVERIPAGPTSAQGIPAISLVSQTAVATAVINDIAGDMLFAQQVNALGQEGVSSGPFLPLEIPAI